MAASSSPPRQAEPHRVGLHWYIDAGISRGTSADRSESARVLVVVTPLAGRVLGAFGRISEQVTRYEMARWWQRTGGDVLYVRPTPEIAELPGRRAARVHDVDIGRRTYRAAYELGLGCADRFRCPHPAAAAAAVGLAA